MPRQKRSVNIDRHDTRSCENRVGQDSAVGRDHQQIGIQGAKLGEEFRRANLRRLEQRQPAPLRRCTDLARLEF